MTSPARRHFLRVTAARAAQADAQPLRHATGHELMLAQLAEHRRGLKRIQSIERKADFKRHILPEYDAWIAGALEGDSGLQDEVFMTVMVWRIDVGDFKGALPMAAYAIRHGLAMPDHYARTTACLIAEEFAGMVLKAPEAIKSEDVEALAEVEVLVRDQDMPDEVRAKLHKALGLAVAEVATGQDAATVNACRKEALAHLRRALELHDKSGVKKDIERSEREIKNAAPPGALKGDGKS